MAPAFFGASQRRMNAEQGLLAIPLSHAMPLSGFKKFAVVGTSNVGSFIVDALFKSRFNHTPPSKDKEQNKVFAARGVRIAAADFTDVSALTTALGDAQLGLKGALQAKLREVGPPLLLVYTGTFADIPWTGIVGLDVTTGKVAPTWRAPSHMSSHSRPRGAAAELDPTSRWRLRVVQRGIQGLRGTHRQEARRDRSLDSLRTKLVENPQDFDAYLHLNLATDG
ncbi:hypothetical protein EDB85DRAFT_2140965 [Lactarius pseudohatsudake]|nr:hypothetical protein EDB85DRAFT_2140965 [Lactarius pseudohatsudake]